MFKLSIENKALNKILNKLINNKMKFSIFILLKYIIKNKNKKFNISAIAIPVIAFIISENIFGIYYFHTSILEIVTIPIQTLARYSRDYNEDISIEEKMDVNGFINYDLAGELYNPVLVDPARNNAGNYFSTNEEKIKFFKVWTYYHYHGMLSY